MVEYIREQFYYNAEFRYYKNVFIRLSLETAKATVLEFVEEFSFLLKDIKNCIVVETRKPKSLLHFFQNRTE